MNVSSYRPACRSTGPSVCRRSRRFAPWLLGAALVALLGTGPLLGEEEPTLCEKRCQPRQPKAAFIEIDANTGEILSGSTTFAEGERVQVIISGKNPYKYAYRTQVVATPLDQSLITSFLGLIPGANVLSGLFSSLNPVQQLGVGSQEPAGLDSPLCRDKKEALGKVIDVSNQVVAAYGSLKKSATDTETAYKAYEKFLLDTDRESLGESCVEICDAGNKLLGSLDSLEDMKELKEGSAALAKASEELGKQIAEVKKGLPEDQCGLGDDIKTVDEVMKKSGETAEKVLKTAQDIEAAKPGLESLEKIIKRVQVNDRAFSEEHFPYTQGEPTGVKVSLFQTNQREENAKEKAVGEVNLTIGRSRFALSAGVGFSTIEDVTIVKQGNKLGEENQSDLRPSLTVMLNTQLGRFWRAVDGPDAPDGTSTAATKVRTPSRSSWGLATGLVLTQRNSTTEAEFIVGPSFGFLDDRFFVVLGYHTARVQSLRSKDLPASTTDIPVDKDWASGAMLAITYKLR